MKLMFTHQSDENSTYRYWANIIQDNEKLKDDQPSYIWFGDADNDVDGCPYWNEDPYGQPETSLTYQGKPINGDQVPFIVVPPQVINMIVGVVLGCAGEMDYNGKHVDCVVADSGPKSKIGECSPAALRALGLPAPHNGNGGLDTQEILYRIWPGVAAVVNGITYNLQHS
jgi:hypothetical protein